MPLCDRVSKDSTREKDKNSEEREPPNLGVDLNSLSKDRVDGDGNV